MSDIEANSTTLSKTHIPQQIDGGKSDAVETIDLKDEALAISFFHATREKLYDVNNWARISKITLSKFKLFDREGQPVNRPVREQDFIRIDIPGPGLHIGKGFDWVYVESILDEVRAEESVFSIRVYPAPCPGSPTGRIAHFLHAHASSTFQICRLGTIVRAEEHARNEKANLKTGNWKDNLRNLIVGVAASLGLSYPQWKSLVKGLIN